MIVAILASGVSLLGVCWQFSLFATRICELELPTGSFPGECESAAAAAIFDLNVLGLLSLNLSCQLLF